MILPGTVREIEAAWKVQGICAYVTPSDIQSQVQPLRTFLLPAGSYLLSYFGGRENTLDTIGSVAAKKLPMEKKLISHGFSKAYQNKPERLLQANKFNPLSPVHMGLDGFPGR